jgi:YidC/Oxa1 family membrane protein insertase
MELYKEMGINPFGSCLPTLIQFPIIIGLYQAIITAMATTPLQLVNFLESIYKFPVGSFLYNIFPSPSEILPLQSNFLWMNLGQPERFTIPGVPFEIPLLAILVVITSYFQTKLMTPMSTNSNDQSAAMTRMMGLYMPLFIGWLAYSFPAGLAVYFVASNLVGIIQYALMGRLDFRNLLPKRDQPELDPKAGKPIPKKKPAPEKRLQKSRKGSSSRRSSSKKR